MISYLRPDSKAQVTLEYSYDNKPSKIINIVISTQHDEFDEEDKMLKMSYEMSKRWREMRLNKAPAKDLVDRCEGRKTDG